MKGRKEHKRAEGGSIKRESEEDGGGDVKAYDAAGSNVEKEAKERKKGGKCMPERKKGGSVMKAEHRVEGKAAKMRLDRPGRKMGGRVGSDKSPLSSAHNVSSVVEHRTDD